MWELSAETVDFCYIAFGTCIREIDFVSLGALVILIFHIKKSAKSVRSDRYKMQFSGIITIHILQFNGYLGDWPFL